MLGPLSLDAAGLMTLDLGQIAAMPIGSEDVAWRLANQSAGICKHLVAALDKASKQTIRVDRCWKSFGFPFELLDD
ncbi:hypothetical protein CFAM422_011630 [Trichoderma lentiforme]|uniref:Uncharacterized protein n=1 Tax=Trichoderma lentiforme TaxID=1567552 RepID=A0A9P4X5T8_9HYPO|nr:hypothetical protein CFAM422_011630 [Trichoderma lentiforme]